MSIGLTDKKKGSVPFCGDPEQLPQECCTLDDSLDSSFFPFPHVILHKLEGGTKGARWWLAWNCLCVCMHICTYTKIYKANKIITHNMFIIFISMLKFVLCFSDLCQFLCLSYFRQIFFLWSDKKLICKWVLSIKSHGTLCCISIGLYIKKKVIDKIGKLYL